MELIKLLDVANPKLIKDTLNKVSQEYETFRTVIEETANAALNTAVTANDTANTALTTVTDYEAIVMESAQDSSNARLVAEEALAMITQADERSQEAALLAEQSFTEASEAVQTSELAMNVANEAKSTVDQALDIGTLGSFVHNINGIALAHAHMTDDPNQADDEELSFLATPTLVREAIKDKADLTNTEQTIIAGRLEINDGALDFSNEGAGIYMHGERPRLIFKADGIVGKANSGHIQGTERGLSVTSPGTLSMYANEDIKLIPDGYIILDTDTNVNGPLSVSGNTNITGNLSVTGRVTVPTPSENEDAVPKSYVDDHLTTRTTLWQGSTNVSDVTITDIRNFKYVILYVKFADEWLSVIYDTVFLAGEIASPYPTQIVVQDNTPDSYRFGNIFFNSYTSINTKLSNAIYMYFVGIN